MNEDLDQLEIISTIAFQGKTRNGLVFHVDKKHVAYSVGQNVMVREISSGKEYRYYGHSNTVSCVAVAKDGSFLASGQENFMGFKADVIIWNFQDQTIYARHNIHRVKVEAVAFTCDSKYIISLGGQDCGNVVIYDVDSSALLCGNVAAPLAGGYANILRCANTRNDIFVSAGNNSLRIWKINFRSKRVTPTNASIGRIRREIKCVDIDIADNYLYCGTASGDILKLQIVLSEEGFDAKLLNCLMRIVSKEIIRDIPLFSGGVTAIAVLKTGELLIGTGDGIVCRCSQVECPVKDLTKKPHTGTVPTKKTKAKQVKIEMKLKELEKTLILGEVTSIALRGDGHQFLVGSQKSEIYQVTLIGFKCERIYTCHGKAVRDVVFPYKCSDLFTTCSFETIRVWNLASSLELLRIEVPNMTCHSVLVMRDGRSIISGWNDGKIRAHTPETGHPIYIIENAHQRGVTAIAATSNCRNIISGGGEGDVRVWNVTTSVQVLLRTMKEHKGAITCIKVKSNDKECVTSAGDGSCIIWDLENFIRMQVVFANTIFQAVCYGPEEYQIISCGTDRKISYYEVLDGTMVRSLEASLSGSINAMDITDDCKLFVTGGADKLIKVWKYLEGTVTHVGYGHSDEITALKISPNKKHIISVAKDGSIIRWKFPAQLQ
ncbi:cilia- and flagella-associated protein 52 isoform X2 [Parasteatoda tepidariorum]|uniref:cilia- and flagella-associated protein 52 isoform X2 n=1 Tax=Parasteatoda tepidariorum TaxID=114398 RepID=UPI001C7266C9|nr:cilia- and flagella-associated protein 52-like isoform X3 [Parasteatoda tepidariorum]